MKFSIVFTALVAGAALLAYAPEGAEAASLQPRAKSCRVSSQCDQSKNQYCKHGKCASMKPVGGNCYKSQGCLSGLCFNKKCVNNNNRPLGAACSTSDQCKTAYCKRGTCDVKKVNGHACYKDAGCKSGYCNKSKKCGTRKSPSTPTQTTVAPTVSPSVAAPAATGASNVVAVPVMSSIADDSTTTGGATVEVVNVNNEPVASAGFPGGDSPASFTYSATIDDSQKRALASFLRRGDTKSVEAIIFQSFPVAMSVADNAPSSSVGCSITGTTSGVQYSAGSYTVSGLATGDQQRVWSQQEIQSEGSVDDWSITVTCDAYISATIYLAHFQKGTVTQTQTGTPVAPANPSGNVDLKARAVQTTLPVARK